MSMHMYHRHRIRNSTKLYVIDPAYKKTPAKDLAFHHIHGLLFIKCLWYLCLSKTFVINWGFLGFSGIFIKAYLISASKTDAKYKISSVCVHLYFARSNCNLYRSEQPSWYGSVRKATCNPACNRPLLSKITPSLYFFLRNLLLNSISSFHSLFYAFFNVFVQIFKQLDSVNIAFLKLCCPLVWVISGFSKNKHLMEIYLRLVQAFILVWKCNISWGCPSLEWASFLLETIKIVLAIDSVGRLRFCF